MSRAEERARDLGYGTDPLNRAEYTENEVLEAFIEGYHQAEKDFELTWEDVRKIVLIYDNVLNDKDFNTLPIKDGYTEILKRFRKFKERKEK